LIGLEQLTDQDFFIFWQTVEAKKAEQYEFELLIYTINSTMFIYGLKNMIQQKFSFVYLYEWCLANIYLDLNKKFKSQFIRLFRKSKITFTEHEVKSRVQDQIFLWQNPLPLFAYNGKQYYWYFLLKIRSGRNVRFRKSVRCMFVVNIW
jgi:hypothetical protein